jgi:diacylglycerol kinase (ATP)
MIKAREAASDTAGAAEKSAPPNEVLAESLPEIPSNIPPGTRVRVIVNPMSGKKAGFTTNAQGLAEVTAALQEVGINADICETEYPGHATTLAAAAVHDGYEVIIACGGDGTVAETAKALVGKKGVTLGVLPLGSANNVARMTGVPFDLLEAARNLHTGTVKNIDVGKCNGEYFFETAGIGLDAALFPILNKVDKGEYIRLWDVLRTLFKFRQRTLTLVLDKRIVRVKALVVLVANGPYWGYSVPLAPDALIDDHKFDVVVFCNFSKTDFIRHILSALFHRDRAPELQEPGANNPLDHTDHPRVQTFRARHVEVLTAPDSHVPAQTGAHPHSISPANKTSLLNHTHHPNVRTYNARRVQVITSSRRPWPVHADALPRGRTPALIECLPGALRVITGTPAPSSPTSTP